MRGGDSFMKQWIIGGLIVLVLVGSYLWNRNNEDQVQEAENIPAEEILVQEDGSVVKKVGDQIQVMNDEEVQAMKDQVAEKVKDAPKVEIKATEGQEAAGEAASVFKDGEFYQLVTVKGLQFPKKGYYYEGWLQNEAGDRVSIGRVEMSGTTGTIYYSTKEDKSAYNKVVISSEVEDGNPGIGTIVLESTQAMTE